MAKVFVGDPSRTDPDVLAALQTLPDDFWILGEFTLRRNYDWFVVRPIEAAPSALIVAEIKRRSRPIRGSVNAAWDELTEDGDWQAIRPANENDRNYYWQVVNAANSLGEWLRNNEPVFNDGQQGAWQEARVWPDLVVLSPPGTNHQLPLRPDSGFGAWFVDLNRWIGHLMTWRPRVGPQLSQADVQKLVDYLRLQPVQSPGATVSGPAAHVDDSSQNSVASAGSARSGANAVQQISSLSQAVGDLSRRVAHLERTLHRTSRMLAAGAVAWEIKATATRGLTEAERDAIVAAVHQVAARSYVRSYPSVLKQLETILGEDLKANGYRGFGTASALFQQAALEGLIQLGPKRGPSPTVWLPDETPRDD